eukprot:TRINITY_DN9911_c0_g1_i3.p1 TRINITY_DN9911_c0_g1~~TRINITY_DN9911_c0_g1_i3.p1  ORF type:complete len:785 (-),score=140.56 TRINITY_DN9911_c0_g1_i3:1067-3421(-)
MAVTQREAIAYLCKEHDWPEVLLLLEQLCTESVQPNIVTCNAALSALDRCHAWPQAIQLVEKLRCDGLTPTVITSNAALHALLRADNWQQAYDKLKALREDKFQPNLVTCNSLASHCTAKCDWLLALQLLTASRQLGLQPDTVSYRAAAYACDSARAWRAVLLLLRSYRAGRLRPDARVWNLMMRSCPAHLAEHVATELLRELHSSGLQLGEHSYTAAVSALAKGFAWGQCLEMLCAMEDEGLQPEAAALAAAVHACTGGKAWMSAGHVLLAMKNEGLEPALPLFAGLELSRPLERLQRWEKQLQCMERLRYLGFCNGSRDPQVLLASLLACKESSRWQWTLQLHVLQKWAASLETCADLAALRSTGRNAAISSCGQAWCWQAAVALLRASTAWIPDLLALSAAGSACASGRRWELAAELMLPELRQLGLELDGIACGAALAALEQGQRWDAALKMLSQLGRQRIQADEILLRTVLSAAGRSSRWHAALSVYARQLVLDAVAAETLARACEEQAMWQAAVGLLEGFRAKRLRPNVALCTCAAAAVERGWLNGELPAAAVWLPDLTSSEMLSLLRRGPAKRDFGKVSSAAQLLSEHGLLRGAGALALEQSHRAVTTRLGRLALKRVASPSCRIHDEVLQQHFSCGPGPDLQILSQLGLRGGHSAGRAWTSSARWQGRFGVCVSREPELSLASDEIAAQEDLAAAFLLTWTSFCVQLCRRKSGRPACIQGGARCIQARSRTQGLRSRSRCGGLRLASVVAHHDRSAHSERQVLLDILHTIELGRQL